jgi:hypothetical protein
MSFRVGGWVQVRSQAEILATLDDRGCLDGLPFMPQMVDYCGKRFRVIKRAHKLCDTVWGPHPRKMADAVFLDDLRCNGQTYGGCEMECLIVWKEAWLRGIPDTATADAPTDADTTVPALLELTRRGTRPVGEPDASVERFSCQATQMPVATTALSVWDFRQYVEDYTSGNASLKQIVSVVSFLIYETVIRSGLGFGAVLRWGYDAVQAIRGGTPYPFRTGRLPRQSRTPCANLGVSPGELVKVKTYAEVLDTVTEDLVNRGLHFSPEMVPYCGQTFPVNKRLRRIMNEKTGQVMELKNECVVLEGPTCAGHYARPLLCPRGMSPYWREVWLERVDPTS